MGGAFQRKKINYVIIAKERKRPSLVVFWKSELLSAIVARIYCISSRALLNATPFLTNQIRSYRSDEMSPVTKVFHISFGL